MQAIILAAGMGKRLKELTKNNTKCMVEVNGKTLIDRMLHQIEKKAFSRIIIVVGYEGKKLMDYIGTLDIKTPITFIENPIYDTTNNIYSLSLAKDHMLEEDTILFESDIIFEDSVLDALLTDSRESLVLVDKYESWMDGTVIKLDDADSIVEFVPGKKFKYSEKEEYYKTVNLYKFSKRFAATHYVPFLEAYQAALGENEYYEQVLSVITMLDDPIIKAKRLNGQKWYEIDDIQDLDIAESLFADDEEQLERILQRYGGYWRYPKLLDFCYLVNPYYPPQKMKDEICANFDFLLTQYPSGMKVNSLLAARNFGVHLENILVGNGAAELIKSLMNQFDGKTGFIRPTFEEYPNRYEREDEVVYISQNSDYSYTAEDLVQFFDDKEINNLIVINPDNPSGNYISKADLLKLTEWSKRKGIQLVIDESFADFADEPDNSMIQQDVLDVNPNLYVMKSISKSYGVPGLRLGVLASGNAECIEKLKKDVAIWNINSFAEFYMQISEKYKKDYQIALERLRAERTRLQAELSSINGLRVIPSQANYVMAELQGDTSSRKLQKALLVRYRILIKDLSSKTNGKEYIRIAVRNTEENDKLLDARRQELGKGI